MSEQIAETRAKWAAASRRFRAAHPERVAAKDARFRAADLEGARARGRLAAARSYARHPEVYRARARAFYQANKALWRGYNDLRKAATRGEAIEQVSRLAVLELSDGVCALCGEDLDPTSFHIDHIVALSKGGWHGYDNVQAAHPLCNLRKRAD